MGRGRIVSAHGEGRYTVEIVEDRSRADRARAQAEQRIAEINGQIADAEQAVADAQQDVDSAAAAQDAAINQYRQQLATGETPTVDIAQTAQTLQEAAGRRDAARLALNQYKSNRLSLQTRIDRINALPPLRQIETWCADYTEDLSGEVATAEVPGEIGQVLVRPGFSDRAAWNVARDGAIQPALSGTPASTFYNLAMLPGWQKWRPTFRIATVSNINNDLCDIALDAAASSQQGLNVNAQTSYSSVPIMYMDCNGDAFEEGDRALVAFSGATGQPMVIGFANGPRECCSCEPTVLGSSPSSGTWNVMDIYGSEPVEACPTDQWRIIDTATQEVLNQGGLTKSDGKLYLDGLPEDIDVRYSEVQGTWSGCSPPDTPEADEFTVTFPTPDPSFYGGTWAFVGTSGGYEGTISDTGQIVDWSGEVMDSYLFIWSDGAGCGTVDLVYTPAMPSNYELQLGCSVADGGYEWP